MHLNPNSALQKGSILPFWRLCWWGMKTGYTVCSGNPHSPLTPHPKIPSQHSLCAYCPLLWTAQWCCGVQTRPQVSSSHLMFACLYCSPLVCKDAQEVWQTPCKPVDTDWILSIVWVHHIISCLCCMNNTACVYTWGMRLSPTSKSVSICICVAIAALLLRALGIVVMVMQGCG